MLLNSDARSLPLADGCVDLVITSPPYNVGLPYENYNDKLPNEEFMRFIKEALIEIYRVMSETSRAYFIVSDAMIYWMKPLAEHIGYIYGQLMVWCKPNLAGGSGKITGDWNFLTENIMLFRKGKRTPMLNANVNTHNFFVIPTPQRNFNKDRKLHIAQFPLRLIKILIARTPGDVVLDPFMGSGTVGIACLQMGRDFIGIDIDRGYVSMANNRIKEAQLQIRMPL